MSSSTFVTLTAARRGGNGFADQLAVWREGPITTLIAELTDPSMAEALAQLW